LHPV
jgi:polygalacturonase